MDIDEQDKQLFRDAVDNFAVENKDDIHVSKAFKQSLFTEYNYITEATIGAEEMVNYAKNGASSKLINKMKRGQIDNPPMIDLHGYTIKQACEALSRFIYQHQFEQFIHIIHGKGYRSNNGMSVLKTQVVNFLTQHPQVLACHSCPHKNGGTGAIFALLKHNKSNAR